MSPFDSAAAFAAFVAPLPEGPALSLGVPSPFVPLSRDEAEPPSADEPMPCSRCAFEQPTASTSAPASVPGQRSSPLFRPSWSPSSVAPQPSGPTRVPGGVSGQRSTVSGRPSASESA